MVKFKIIYFFKSYDAYSLLKPDDYLFLYKKVYFLKELIRYDETLNWLNLKYFIFYSYDKIIELNPN